MRYPELNESVQSLFADQLELILSEGESNASSWSLCINHFVNNLGFNLSAEATLKLLRERSAAIESENDEQRKSVLRYYPDWVENIVSKNILPIPATPPQY